jgi:hypothetical protein
VVELIAVMFRVASIASVEELTKSMGIPTRRYCTVVTVTVFAPSAVIAVRPPV